MTRVVAILLALAPLTAFALDSDEFLLFGIDGSGHSVDIYPYGGEGNADEADGDMNEPGGIHGHFYRLVGSFAKGSLQQVAGTCRLIGKGAWTFTCESGTLLLSGVTYTGKAITDAKAPLPPAVRRVYRAFLKRYEYGEPAAMFHCTANCGPRVPEDLILVWRGD